jgi:SNF2 family DNA or RNA helicase
VLASPAPAAWLRTGSGTTATRVAATLVVVPQSLVAQWQDEAKKRTRLATSDATLIIAPDSANAIVENRRRCQLVVVTYEWVEAHGAALADQVGAGSVSGALVERPRLVLFE